MNAEKRYEEFEVNDWFEEEAVKAKLKPLFDIIEQEELLDDNNQFYYAVDLYDADNNYQKAIDDLQALNQKTSLGGK